MPEIPMPSMYWSRRPVHNRNSDLHDAVAMAMIQSSSTISTSPTTEITTNMDAVIGVDPGTSGAAMLLRSDRTYEIIRFDQIDELEIWDYIRDWTIYNNVKLALIEKVHARPEDARRGEGNSIPQLATFMQNTGMIKGFLLAAMIRYEEIDPRRWQQEFGLGARQTPEGTNPQEEYRARKRAHKAKAASLFPEANVTLDQADGILLAEYAWRRTFTMLQRERGTVEGRPAPTARVAGSGEQVTNVNRRQRRG